MRANKIRRLLHTTVHGATITKHHKILERVLTNLTQYALEAIGDAHHSAPFASIQDMSQESLYELRLQIQFQFKKRHVKLCMLTFVLTIGLSFS